MKFETLKPPAAEVRFRSHKISTVIRLLILVKFIFKTVVDTIDD